MNKDIALMHKLEHNINRYINYTSSCKNKVTTPQGDIQWRYLYCLAHDILELTIHYQVVKNSRIKAKDRDNILVKLETSFLCWSNMFYCRAFEPRNRTGIAHTKKAIKILQTAQRLLLKIKSDFSKN